MARGHDKHQRRLPLSRSERLEALERFDPATVGIGPRAWRSVRELLRQIEFTTGADGCFCYVETIAARMSVTRRTAQRASEAAIAAGLLTVAKRHDGRHQQSNQWRVEWGRIAGSLELSPTPDELTPRGDELTPRGDVMTPSIRNRTLQSSLEVSSPYPLPRRTASSDAADWDGVVVEVFGCGVEQAERAVRSLRVHGGTPDDARAIVAAWHERRSQWDELVRPAKLYRRLCYWRPGQDPRGLWPPGKTARSPRSEDRTTLERRREFAERRAQRASEPAVDLLAEFARLNAQRSAT